MANATLTKDAKFADEDVGNIILMEHVNVQIDDQAKATLFYLVGLGFTRDPHMMVGLTNMWVNLGEQQFHLPTREPQVLRGHIGVVVPSLDALADRLKSIEPELAGTKFDWHREEGFIGLNWRQHEFVTECTILDSVLCLMRDGSLKVAKSRVDTIRSSESMVATRNQPAP